MLSCIPCHLMSNTFTYSFPTSEMFLMLHAVGHYKEEFERRLRINLYVVKWFCYLKFTQLKSKVNQSTVTKERIRPWAPATLDIQRMGT